MASMPAADLKHILANTAVVDVAATSTEVPTTITTIVGAETNRKIDHDRSMLYRARSPGCWSRPNSSDDSCII